MLSAVDGPPKLMETIPIFMTTFVPPRSPHVDTPPTLTLALALALTLALTLAL